MTENVIKTLEEEWAKERRTFETDLKKFETWPPEEHRKAVKEFVDSGWKDALRQMNEPFEKEFQKNPINALGLSVAGLSGEYMGRRMRDAVRLYSLRHEIETLKNRVNNLEARLQVSGKGI